MPVRARSQRGKSQDGDGSACWYVSAPHYYWWIPYHYWETGDCVGWAHFLCHLPEGTHHFFLPRVVGLL